MNLKRSCAKIENEHKLKGQNFDEIWRNSPIFFDFFSHFSSLFSKNDLVLKKTMRDVRGHQRGHCECTFTILEIS